MKEIKNYRNIRKEPNIFGYSFINFINMLMSVFISLTIFITGTTLYHFIFFILLTFFFVIFFRFKNMNILKKNVFPDEINDLTKNS